MQRVAATLLLLATARAHAETPWEHYLTTLSPQAAASVKRIEYTLPASPEAEGPRITEGIALLATQVLAGDREAFQLAFRLASTTAPGANLEDLTVLVGRYARINPKAFLQAQAKAPDCIGIASIGPEFVDRPEARIHELRARGAALLSVHAPALQQAQTRCLMELDGLQP